METEGEKKIVQILIADDEQDICFLLKTIIKRTFGNVVVKTVNSVAEGKAKLAAEEFDLFLFDMRLGDGSGLELINLAHKLYQDPNIIVISAYSSKRDIEQLKRHGVDCFIAKPIVKEDLINNLRRIVA